jgi:hypothetical protein
MTFFFSRGTLSLYRSRAGTMRQWVTFMATAIDKIRYRAGTLLAIGLLTPLLGLSQQQPTTGATQDPGAAPTAGQSPDATPPSDQQQPNAAGTTQGFFVRALNSAGPLVGENGPLQWGWISVRSASFLEYFSQVNFANPSIQPQNENIDASELSASIVVDRAFKRSHLTIQYTPSLAISNGNVYSNALNQTAGLDTSFQLNSRWSLQVTDRFSYVGSQRTFSGQVLSTDYSTGISAPQNFLYGPGSVLYNVIFASFTYLWSPRTTVSFAPSFGYQYGTGAVNPAANVTGFSEGGNLTFSHLLSPTKTIGFTYTGQYANYTNSSVSAGPQSNAVIQDFLVTYSQQVSTSLWIHLGLGITTTTGGESGSGLAMNASITKNFHRSDLALFYNRGHQFNGFVTSGASDNVGVTHTIYWTSRLSTATSGDYLRTPNAFPSTQSAWYASEQLNFGLTRRLSLSGSFAYLNQLGDGVYVLNSNRRFATVGITWSAQQPALH